MCRNFRHYFDTIALQLMNIEVRENLRQPSYLHAFALLQAAPRPE